ncbi:MAG: hypothetical protein BWX88_03985 [Planctomycetes bacterium ADurb.Bin126]|nr:MAG: hypothetical protein BWX88_03985 [Planctomycetes bacterium ADurb.Bin126]
MVIGHHLMFTGYGHWLPNDPRGSLSLRAYPFVKPYDDWPFQGQIKSKR